MILLLALLAGCNAIGPSFREVSFLKGPTETQGLIPTGGFLREASARSLIDCARTCTENQNCSAMYYLNDTNGCKSHSQKMGAVVGDIVSCPEAMYYEVERNDQTSTTSTTTAISPTTATPLTENSPCPPDDSIFRLAQTSNGTQFQFRVLMDVHVNFTEADDLCKNHGAKLYKILNADKLAFTQQLMTCAAYSSYNFWINGMYNVTIGSYTTLEGEPIPEPSVLWAPDRPNGWDTQPCVWLANMHTYYLDDNGCNTISDFPTFTICEI